MRQKFGSFALLTVVVILAALSPLTGGDLRADAPVSSGKIHGRLLNSHKKPAANLAVTLQTIPGRGQMPLLVGTTNTDDSGNFHFAVATGTYRVEAASLNESASSKVTVYKNVTSSVLMILR